MSSILDALKKSERQRGLGRDLIFRNSAPDERPRLTWFARAVLLALLLLAVAIAVVLFSLRQSEAPESVTLATPEPATEVANAPAARAAPVSAAPVASVRVETAQELMDQTRVEKRPPAAIPSAPVEVLTEMSGQTEEAPWLSSLPESFRSGLPPLDVNIHVYSPEESQRILYINNRQVRQGERIQAGVLVEEIVQDGVVLRFRGQRFKLPRPS